MDYMSFEEKVRAMSGKEIVMAMVNGLRAKHVNIKMMTFGASIGGTCYGCAATNAICEISGKVFTPKNIRFANERASFIGTGLVFLHSFEDAINYLREGDIETYNEIAGNTGMAKLNEIDGCRLPYLGNDFTEDDLQAYERFAEEQEVAENES